MAGELADKNIFVEQVKQHLKQVRSMTLLGLLVAAIATSILLGHVPAHILLPWFAGVLLFAALRLWEYRRSQHEDVNIDNVSVRGAFIVGHSFLSGLTWGVLGMIAPDLSNPYVMVLLAIFLCGLVVGSISFLSTHMPAYLAFALPCIIPFSIRCLLSQQGGLVAVGFLLLIFLTICLLTCHLTHKNTLKGIHLLLENKELIEKLQHEKSNAIDARAIAEENNQAKSRYLAAASHDLRQPLHAMGFFVEALRGERRPDRINRLVQKIAQTSDALRNLLGSLLDISKIEAGGIEPCRSHFTVNEMLVEIIQEFTGLAQEKGLTIDCQPCSHTVYSDKEMLGRIVRNLVSNAVRYTDHGYVTISSESEGRDVFIRISDSGRGIAESDRSDIFREFFQIEGAGPEGSQGLGLGLSIVKGLCRLLDHEINLYSETGVGSVFSVKVPLGDLHNVISQDTDATIRSGEVLAKVIILNNEDASLESISGIMRRWGYIVADFNTWGEAQDFLTSEEFIPDLVISDIKLRDVSGIEAVDAIQKKIDRKIPGIIMTGDAGGAIIDQVRSNGFSLLQKPVQPAKLRSMVAYAVQGEI